VNRPVLRNTITERGAAGHASRCLPASTVRETSRWQGVCGVLLTFFFALRTGVMLFGWIWNAAKMYDSCRAVWNVTVYVQYYVHAQS
jgi:hypothetical protein